MSLTITGNAVGAAPASWTIVEDAPLGKGIRFAVVLGLHLLFVLGLLHVQQPPVAESEPVRMAVRVIEMPAAAPVSVPEPPVVLLEPPIAPPPPVPEVRRPEPRPVAVREPVTPPVTTLPPPAPAEPRAPAPVAPVVVTAVRFDAAYLNNPAPRYPTLSRRRGEQGRVLLQVRVDAHGLPQQVEIHQGSGYERLDEAALEAVRRWRFIPARRGDEAITASVRVPIVFHLDR